MKLHRIELALFIGNCGKRRAVRHSHHPEAARQRPDTVAMAHPHLVALALRPHSLEQRAVIGDLEKGAAELAMVGRLHRPAELRAHHLLAIADAEHRQPQPEHPLGRPRTFSLQHARRPARQDDSLQAVALKRALGQLIGHDFRIDARFPHAPGDQLGDLRPEIDDQDPFGDRHVQPLPIRCPWRKLHISKYHR
jgi:hypothetical protein